MTNQNWLEYKIQVRNRLKAFSIRILQLSELFPKSERCRILNNQVTRSGTSVYANYRAALRGRSKAEFFSKLSVAVEEADETEMWLDLIISSEVLSSSFIKELHTDSLEFVKILASMRKRVSK